MYKSIYLVAIILIIPVIAQAQNKDIKLKPDDQKENASSKSSDNSEKDESVNSSKDTNSDKKDGEDHKSPHGNSQDDKKFIQLRAGLLGLYDFNSSNFGVEGQVYVETNYFHIPLEWQYIYQDSFNIKTWPSFFLSKREDALSGGTFASIFTESNVKVSQTEASRFELGLGGGFSSGLFSIAAWFSTSFYQGTPIVEELFNFRVLTVIQKSKFMGSIGLKLGTAIVTGTLLTTSTTTFGLDMDMGYDIYNGIYLIAGLDIATDNLGEQIEDKALVDGIPGDFKYTLKLGLNYKL